MDDPTPDLATPPPDPVPLIPTGAAKAADVPPPILERLERQAAGLLRSLVQLAPDAARLLKTLKDGEAFHVVMQGRTGDLKKAGDGLLHAWVQDGAGKFKEQALLRPAGLDPAALSALSGLAINAMLLELAAKMDALHGDVRNVKALLQAQFDGELLGAVRQYPTVCRMSDDAQRKAALTQLAGDLHKLIAGALERVSVELARQPSSTKTLPATLTDDDVARTWDGLRQRMALALQGIRTLIFCYQDLGEVDAAQHALEQMLDHLAKLDFPGAASKARLAPWRKDDPPEQVWAKIPGLIVQARQRLADAKDGRFTLDVTLRPENLLS
ncbi:hypothetical protein [Roseicella frigidaeris]|uniref:hypothetical protein n=1 Tax=Roseicella frigidaeris TaxID=2230885 RepID=UPI000FDD0FD3|nr:hypothetical protein [Roseicella frigidaeris]